MFERLLNAHRQACKKNAVSGVVHNSSVQLSSAYCQPGRAWDITGRARACMAQSVTAYAFSANYTNCQLCNEPHDIMLTLSSHLMHE